MVVAKPEELQKVMPSQLKINAEKINHVFALGTLGYDFSSESRCDAFRQLMSAGLKNGVSFPPNPHNENQLVSYLQGNLSEVSSLTITLNIDTLPAYAIEAEGPFAKEVYELLITLLNEQIKHRSDKQRVERISLPRVQTDQMITLFSGQAVPLVKISSCRGIYGWRTESLIEDTISAISNGYNNICLRSTLQDF